MRTDDFEDDITPGDPNEPRPDKTIDVNDQGESFNEFDQPHTSGGNSLGDIWRNNPLIKIAVLVIGAVVVIAGYMIFGGRNTDAPHSTVGTAVQDKEAPGGLTSQSYENAINDVNEQRRTEAEITGQSHIDIPTSGPDTAATQPVTDEPPVTLEDPLNQWRAQTQQPQSQAPQLEQMPANTNMSQAPVQQQRPLGPDPAAVQALSQAMSQQMASILDKHKINGAQIMQVTTADFMNKQNAAATATQAVTDATPEVVQEILIPAGTIVYAQTMTEANSDVPGPVLARISSGPLTGSRILGTFQTTEEKLILKFDKVVINGIDYPINGVALDPKTTLPAVASDVDHRYFDRFILPAAAEFITGMADAISNREQTNVSVNGSTVTSSKPDLNTTEELAAGLSAGTQNIADDLNDEGNQIQPRVRVYAGTPIGILFLDPVIKPE